MPDWYFWFPDRDRRLLRRVGRRARPVGVLPHARRRRAPARRRVLHRAQPLRPVADRGARPRGRGRDRRHQPRPGEGDGVRAERALRRDAGSLSVLVTRLAERRQGRDVPALDRVPRRGRDRRRRDGDRPDARRRSSSSSSSDQIDDSRSPERPVLRPEPREAALAGDLRHRADHLDVRPARRDRRRLRRRGLRRAHAVDDHAPPTPLAS